MSDQRDGGIGWTDHTWNPIRGCSKVSQGCKHCYAETVARRFSKPGQPYAGLVREDGTWNGEIRFVETALVEPLRWTRPRRVFVNSMSDLFHENVSNDWLDRMFAVMALARRHTFQCLTKRPERMRDYLAADETFERVSELAMSYQYAKNFDDVVEFDARDAHENLSGFWPLPNVWLGVSVEDQETAEERIPALLKTPAAVRWVSYEPALGPVDLVDYGQGTSWLTCHQRCSARSESTCLSHEYSGECFRGVDWVVVGGESGNGARPFDLAWARSTVAQCREAGVPVFVKQLGSRPFDSDYRFGVYAPQDRRSPSKPDGAGGEMARGNLVLVTRKGGDMAEWPAELRVQEWPK